MGILRYASFRTLANFFDLLSSVVSLLYPSYHLSTDGKGQSLKLGHRKALFHGHHGLADASQNILST